MADAANGGSEPDQRNDRPSRQRSTRFANLKCASIDWRSHPEYVANCLDAPRDSADHPPDHPAILLRPPPYPRRMPCCLWVPPHAKDGEAHHQQVPKELPYRGARAEAGEGWWRLMTREQSRLPPRGLVRPINDGIPNSRYAVTHENVPVLPCYAHGLFVMANG